MNRILFFVHYNKYNGLSDYVLYLLEHIKHIYNRLVFISNSHLSDENKKCLAGFCDDLIIRENKGFDFGAWKDALLKEGWDKLSQYDSLTLMNDTCFGPLFNVEPIYTGMEQKCIDFWGLTLYQKTKSGMPGNNRAIPEHIQSYFLCFNKPVVLSPVFQRFWNNVKYQNNIAKVISHYETQLTSLLSGSGFKYTVTYTPVFYSNTEHKDVSAMQPDIVIKNNVPLIKIKSFLNFPHQKYIFDLIRERTDYPTELIFDHITDIYEPGLSLQICDKLIPAIDTTECTVSLKIAVHLHVFYFDIFEKYVYYLNKISSSFDLFITTDTEDKKNQIRAYINNTNMEKSLKEIIVTENRGRDILPWLNLANVLENYDIVGHFHTKKSMLSDEYFGITWMREIFELMLVPYNAIIDMFQQNTNIGIIIPEIPYIYQKISPYINFDGTNYHSLLENIWMRMKCKKQIDFRNIDTLIMPYGSMFWYRPRALHSLFQLQLSANEFMKEPIPIDRTLVHCIEKILVYTAWNAGFDYRIVTYKTQKTSSFFHNIILNQNYAKLISTRTYRIMKFILAVLKMIKKIFKRVVQ